jgi:hypothetical protein
MSLRLTNAFKIRIVSCRGCFVNVFLLDKRNSNLTFWVDGLSCRRFSCETAEFCNFHAMDKSFRHSISLLSGVIHQCLIDCELIASQSSINVESMDYSFEHSAPSNTSGLTTSGALIKMLLQSFGSSAPLGGFKSDCMRSSRRHRAFMAPKTKRSRGRSSPVSHRGIN